MPRAICCCRRRRRSLSDHSYQVIEISRSPAPASESESSKSTFDSEGESGDESEDERGSTNSNARIRVKHRSGGAPKETNRNAVTSQHRGPAKILKMAEMKNTVDQLRKTFAAGKTKSLEFRQAQLKQLAAMLEDNRQSWKDALRKDMGRCDFEAELCELVPVVAEATSTHNELRDWAKPEKAKTGTLNAMDTAVIQREPLGLCLIISSWNYPLQYTLTPLIGAIAAGNVVIVKASSKCPSTTDLMTHLFPKYLDPSAFVVIGGGVDVGAQLLADFDLDFVLFTGKTSTGKAVMKAAAEKLTPVSLHLGGKNPVYVDNHCDFDKVARCVIWGKMMNAGQNCAAPDYVLCHDQVLSKFVEAAKKATRNFYGEDPKKSACFGRIVDAEEWKRVADLIQREKVVVGGETDEGSLYIAPTIMTNVVPTDACMKSEIFGPVLPILSVGSIEAAIEFIAARPKPLAVYAFSSKNAVVSQFQESTSSGGFCGNDVLSHLSLASLPASGVGASGLGAPIHGFYSFDAFSHRKSVLIKKMALEGTLSPRYPPFTEGHLNMAKNALKKKFKGGGGGSSGKKKAAEGGDDSD